MTDDLSLVLYDSWMKENPSLTHEVMSQDKCDIEPAFMCFADVYYHLSQIIPKHWTIVDLGCAFAPQCLYFKDHKKYIGVDLHEFKKFSTKNTESFQGSIRKFMADMKYESLNLKETFAIISYVPADSLTYMIVQTTFKNLFVYYPCGFDGQNPKDTHEIAEKL